MVVLRRWLKRAAGLTLVVGAGVAAFDLTNYNVISRSCRCMYRGAKVVYLYKTTEPQSVEELDALHLRAATLLRDTCLQNEGLYIKLGQGVSTMNHVMPPVTTEVFKVLLDMAPTVDPATVRTIIEEELATLPQQHHAAVTTGSGVGVTKHVSQYLVPVSSGGPNAKPPRFEDLFVEFDWTPVASASIAQVHKAKVRDGRTGALIDVAVKVQKPNIRKQIWWDLQCHYLICYGIERFFGIPTLFNTKTIDDNLTREVNFFIEADNTERLRRNLADRNDVYVPRVVPELLTERLLVTEWIDAVKLNDKQGLEQRIIGPGVATRRQMMQTTMEAFGDMVFKHGFVHCDPHPANVLVRPTPPAAAPVDSDKATTTPNNSKKASPYQIVLLDSGLCIEERPTFQMEYSLFFKSMFSMDLPEMGALVRRWGVGDGELFASLTLQRPYNGTDAGGRHGHGPGSAQPNHQYTPEEVAAMEQQVKDRLKSFLTNEELVPPELIFVGRCFNILRSVNKQFGSPVNRMQVIAERALRHLEGAGVENVAQLEMWCAAGGDREQYAAALRAAGLGREGWRFHPAAVAVQKMTARARLAAVMTLLQCYHVFVTFYNTVLLAIFVRDAERRRHMALHSIDDVIEDVEETSATEFWTAGPPADAASKAGAAEGHRPHHMQNITLND